MFEEPEPLVSMRIPRPDKAMDYDFDLRTLEKVLIGEEEGFTQSIIVQDEKNKFIHLKSANKAAAYNNFSGVVKWLMVKEEKRILVEDYFYIIGPEDWVEERKEEIVEYLKRVYKRSKVSFKRAAVSSFATVFMLGMVLTIFLSNEILSFGNWLTFWISDNFPISVENSVQEAAIVIVFLIILIGTVAIIRMTNLFLRFNTEFYEIQISQGAGYKGYGLSLIFIAISLIILPFLLSGYFHELGQILLDNWFITYSVILPVAAVFLTLPSLMEYVRRKNKWVDFVSR